MTYGKLQSMLKVLLIGDNPVPKDGDMLLAALEMAYIDIANECTALKLLTVNKAEAIMRDGPGSSYVRMPKLPTVPEDELDIDNELTPAVARIIASYISKEKGGIHKNIAVDIMRKYESKVRSYILRQEGKGEYDNA